MMTELKVSDLGEGSYIKIFTSESQPNPDVYGVGPLFLDDGRVLHSDGADYTNITDSTLKKISSTKNQMLLTIDNFDDISTFTLNGGSAAGANTNVTDGNPVVGDAIKIALTASGARQINKTLPANLANADIQSGWFGQWFKVNDHSLVTRLGVILFNETTGNYQQFPDILVAAENDSRIDNEWTLRLWHGSEMAAGGGAPAFISSTENMVSIRSGIQIGSAGGELSLGPMIYAAKQRPTVSFAFDDSNDTDFLIAKPILDQFGFVATTYTIASKIDTANFLSSAQLKSLKQRGWTIGVHGLIAHVDSPLSGDLTAITNDIAANRDFIVNSSYGTGEYYVFPEGKYVPNSILALRALNFKYAGTVVSRTWPMLLGINNLVSPRQGTAGQTLAALKAKVDEAINRGGNLVFYSHRLDPGASGIHTDINIWRPLVEYVAQKQYAGVLDAGMNVEQLMSRFL